MKVRDERAGELDATRDDVLLGQARDRARDQTAEVEAESIGGLGGAEAVSVGCVLLAEGTYRPVLR